MSEKELSTGRNRTDDRSHQNNSSRAGTQSRRQLLYSLAAGGVAGIAGCSEMDPGAQEVGQTEGDDETKTSGGIEPYSVSIRPVGEVEFEAVPKTWVADYTAYGDMAVALGKGDGLKAMNYGWGYPIQEKFPDVEFKENVPGLWDFDAGQYDKELLYELDADVHFMDPVIMKSADKSWNDEDTEEIATNIGPIFGSHFRETRKAIDYELYEMYEVFKKVAQVFKREERFEALEAVHQELQAEVSDNLPEPEDKPTVALLRTWGEGKFYYQAPHVAGYGRKQYRDLRVKDAFADTDLGPSGEISGTEISYEALLDVDPEIIIFHAGITYQDILEDQREAMAEHSVGKELQAVQNEQIYAGGNNEQGPIINLFQTEMAAKQLYPDAFGEFRGIDETPAKEQLFDRERVAEILTGKT